MDKSHKDYKEGKKVAKQVLKRMEMRGNVIPWCQFAQFESNYLYCTQIEYELIYLMTINVN